MTTKYNCQSGQNPRSEKGYWVKAVDMWRNYRTSY